jgi:SAM-dependent methyltransferase
MTTYGRDFADAYAAHWAWYGPRVWPFLARHAPPAAGAAPSWLDLCCGTGSLLELAAEAGYDTTGVDSSPHQLRHARRGVPAARFVRADVRTLSLGRSFDVVTCMFDSLNYLVRLRCLERALRAARRHLAPGGVFVFDVNTFAGLQDNWCRTSVVRDDDRLVLVETSFDAAKARGLCRITGFVRDGRTWRRFGDDHVQRGYRPEEIGRLLARAGLRFRAYDRMGEGRARKRSDRLFYVCRHARRPYVL